MEQFYRTSLLISEEKLHELSTKTVLLCGVGGVGSYVLEALVRMGIGNFIIVDNDVVSITNLNRQLIALHSTLGQSKVEVAKERAQDINPNVNIKALPLFISKDTISEIFNEKIDYVVDAIDNVTGKLLIIEKAVSLNIPIISSMGTGNKLDPTKLKITDIQKTEYCPLAKVMRYELRKRNINHLKVLFSTELISSLPKVKSDENPNKTIIGSVSFVPSVGGLLIASEVIKDLIK